MVTDERLSERGVIVTDERGVMVTRWGLLRVVLWLQMRSSLREVLWLWMRGPLREVLLLRAGAL